MRREGHELLEARQTRPLLASGATRVDSVVSVTLEPGERLLVFGDGASEAEGAAGRLLGARGMVRIVEEARGLDGADMLEAIESQVDEHARTVRSDLALVLVDA